MLFPVSTFKASWYTCELVWTNAYKTTKQNSNNVGNTFCSVSTCSL